MVQLNKIEGFKKYEISLFSSFMPILIVNLKGVIPMNFRSIEQIMTEQPSIEQKIKYRGKTFKLTKTAHDISHGGYTDLTRYTYQNEEEHQNLLFFCNKGKIVFVEAELSST